MLRAHRELPPAAGDEGPLAVIADQLDRLDDVSTLHGAMSPFAVPDASALGVRGIPLSRISALGTSARKRASSRARRRAQTLRTASRRTNVLHIKMRDIHLHRPSDGAVRGDAYVGTRAALRLVAMPHKREMKLQRAARFLR